MFCKLIKTSHDQRRILNSYGNLTFGRNSEHRISINLKQIVFYDEKYVIKLPLNFKRHHKPMKWMMVSKTPKIYLLWFLMGFRYLRTRLLLTVRGGVCFFSVRALGGNDGVCAQECAVWLWVTLRALICRTEWKQKLEAPHDLSRTVRWANLLTHAAGNKTLRIRPWLYTLYIGCRGNNKTHTHMNSLSRRGCARVCILWI